MHVTHFYPSPDQLTTKRATCSGQSVQLAPDSSTDGAAQSINGCAYNRSSDRETQSIDSTDRSIGHNIPNLQSHAQIVQLVSHRT